MDWVRIIRTVSDPVRRRVEGWPSGQWQQTVNLPTNVYVGSNPTPSTIAGRIKRLSGYSTTVVQQPSKLRMPVRFRLPAPTEIQPQLRK